MAASQKPRVPELASWRAKKIATTCSIGPRDRLTAISRQIRVLFGDGPFCIPINDLFSFCLGRGPFAPSSLWNFFASFFSVNLDRRKVCLSWNGLLTRINLIKIRRNRAIAKVSKASAIYRSVAWHSNAHCRRASKCSAGWSLCANASRSWSSLFLIYFLSTDSYRCYFFIVHPFFLLYKRTPKPTLFEVNCHHIEP